MKKEVMIIIGVILVLLTINYAFAYVSSYQGFEIKDVGLTDGIYTVNISFHTAKSGGSQLYIQETPGINLSSQEAVVQANGTGSVDYGQDLWVQITFNTTILNREPLFAATSSFEANNSATLGGKTENELNVNSSVYLIGNITESQISDLGSYITDGNTGWGNSYGFYNALTNFTDGLTEGKICVYESSGNINCTYTDQTGSDTNTNVTKIQFNGSDDTFTLTLEQPGLDNITATFTITDDTGASTSRWVTSQEYLYNDTTTIYLNETVLNATIDARDDAGGNSTAEIRTAVNDSNIVYAFNVTCENIGGASSNLCTLSDTDTNTNTNVTDIQITGTTYLTLALEQEGIATNLTTTWPNFDLNLTGDSGSGVVEDTGSLQIYGAGSVSTSASGSGFTITGTNTGNSTAEIQAVAVGGEASGTIGSITIGNDALDDQYYDSEGDLTGLLDDNYVDVAGDTMTGDLIMSSTTINMTANEKICWDDSCNTWIKGNSTAMVLKVN